MTRRRPWDLAARPDWDTTIPPTSYPYGAARTWWERRSPAAKVALALAAVPAGWIVLVLAVVASPFLIGVCIAWALVRPRRRRGGGRVLRRGRGHR